MKTVDFSVRESEPPSRPELLLRPLYFVVLYVMFYLVSIVLSVFLAANFLLVLLFGRRSHKLTKAIALAGAGFLARSLAYLWAATDERPQVAGAGATRSVEFSWQYYPRASRRELLIRAALSPLLWLLVLVEASIITFLAPVQAIFILVFGRRQKDLARWAVAVARLFAQAYCYAFLVTDERPILS